MVGVSNHALDNLDGLIQTDSTLCQEANHFWNNQGWVGIVDLDDCIVCQIMKVAALFNRFVQNQLGCIGDHEVLLENTEQFPLTV